MKIEDLNESLKNAPNYNDSLKSAGVLKVFFRCADCPDLADHGTAGWYCHFNQYVRKKIRYCNPMKDIPDFCPRLPF